MAELSLFAKITPKPEHRDDALATVTDIVERTRAEPGCHCFELHVGEPGDGSLYLVEHWTDEAALASHYAQDYTRRVFDAYQAWLARPVEVTRMRRAA